MYTNKITIILEVIIDAIIRYLLGIGAREAYAFKEIEINIIATIAISKNTFLIFIKTPPFNINMRII